MRTMKEWRSSIIAIVCVALIAIAVVAVVLMMPTRAVTYVRSDTAAAVDAIKKNEIHPAVHFLTALISARFSFSIVLCTPFFFSCA